MKMTLQHETTLSSPNFYNRWVVYALPWLLINGIAWGVVLLYLKHSPATYTSTWAVSVPASSPRTNVNIPGVGQASSYSDSPYISEFADPRENYKFLLGTSELLNLAAAQLQMEPGEFGSPRVSVIDNTTIMTLEIRGNNPEEAQNKAIALQSAFEQRLQALRQEEISRKDTSLTAALKASEDNLRKAQSDLARYKLESGLVSADQVDKIATNLEQLWWMQSEVSAGIERTGSEFNRLSGVLGLTPNEAAEALVLQSDQLFQQYLRDFNTADAELVGLEALYREAHHFVVQKRAEREVYYSALMQQSRTLLGRPVSLTYINKLSLPEGGGSSQRAELFSQLIVLSVQKEGLLSQIEEVINQISLTNSRLSDVAQGEAKLSALQRNLQIAEAVFTSTLTALDLSQSGVSVSYPPVEVLSQPSLPGAANTSRLTYLLLGTATGTLFLTTGLVTLKLRQEVNTRPVNADRYAIKETYSG